MGLLLAPYNNGMRLGQGFNSYTQQICIDDAVVVDTERAENVVTNDGTTMRILAEENKKLSSWLRQKEKLIGPESQLTSLEDEDEEGEEKKEEEDGGKNHGANKTKGEDGENEDEGTEEEDEGKDNGAEEKEGKDGENEDEGTEEKEHDDDAPKKDPNNESSNRSTEELRKVKAQDKPEDQDKASRDNKSQGGTHTGSQAEKGKHRAPEKTKPGPSEVSTGGVNTPTTSSEERNKSKVSKKASAVVATAKQTEEQPKGVEEGSPEEKIKSATPKTSKSQRKTHSEPRDRKPREKAKKLEDDREKWQRKREKESRDFEKDHGKCIKERYEESQKFKEDVDRLQRENEKLKKLDNGMEKATETSNKEDAEAIKVDASKGLKDKDEKTTEEIENPETGKAEEKGKEKAGKKEDETEEEKAKKKKEAEARAAAAADQNKNALNDEEMEKRKKVVDFDSRPSGLGKNARDYDFDEAAPSGPSQVVTYTSRFVDKLSDITDDMNISGSLSIKYGAIGGSGRGSFIDSDKFKESDLNFYISVKVVNQTINFKDALMFQGLPSVTEDNFRDVFGDSYISGFIEGGEFNALVSMKVLNKAKQTDIQAEAKVALTVGAAELSAEAHVKIAKANISMNTETTIQVSWCGGGNIKPMKEQWNIESLVKAASRFPQLVGKSPQRTYAILTKYESLRSYMALKPAKVSPMEYENAQLYTNTLMETFMAYKSLYRQIATDIFDIQSGTKSFKAKETLSSGERSDERSLKTKETSSDDERSHTKLLKGKQSPRDGEKLLPEDAEPFPATLAGLDEARKKIRKQMSIIVTEVDQIAKKPSILTTDEHKEPFTGSVTFAARLPDVILAKKPSQDTPLTGKLIEPKKVVEGSEEASTPETANETTPSLYNKSIPSNAFSPHETEVMKAFTATRGSDVLHIRVTQPKGSYDEKKTGNSFSNLDFIRPDFVLRSVACEITDGALGALTVSYTNGLTATTGRVRNRHALLRLDHLSSAERVIAGSIETGVAENGNGEAQVTALRLWTNRGRTLNAGAYGLNVKEGKRYKAVASFDFDMPFHQGHLIGFWGKSDEKRSKIWRLGFIWGNKSPMCVTKTSIDAAEKEPVEEDIASTTGSVMATSQGAWNKEQSTTSISSIIKFPKPFQDAPLLIWGLSMLDVPPTSVPRIEYRTSDINLNGFSAIANVESPSNDLGMNWMTLPDNGIHFEYSTLLDRPLKNNSRIQVHFQRPFDNEPKVLVWFWNVSFTNVAIPAENQRLSVHVSANRIERGSFFIEVDTFDGCPLDSAGVGWLAYDSAADGHGIRSGSFEDKEGATMSLGFGREPSVFTAFNSFTADKAKEKKAKIEPVELDKDHLKLSFSSSNPDNKWGACWLAIEN